MGAPKDPAHGGTHDVFALEDPTRALEDPTHAQEEPAHALEDQKFLLRRPHPDAMCTRMGFVGRVLAMGGELPWDQDDVPWAQPCAAQS